MMTLSVIAPIFCAGKASNGWDVSADTLDEIAYDRIVPVLHAHDPSQILGFATAFEVRIDRLWARISIWHPAFIDEIRNGRTWQLSASLETKEFEISEISLVESGWHGDRCALPGYKKAA